jgi:DNA-binding MarR family transcriptional regulator
VERERKSTAEHGAALEQLFELAVLLDEGMEHGLRERGLTAPRAELLWRLGRQGPMTHQSLSQSLQCTPRNVTGLVDALQESGFVTREPHPSDRRAALVSLTEHGNSAVMEMKNRFEQLAARVFDGLSADEMAGFVDTLDRVLSRLRESVSVPASQA